MKPSKFFSKFNPFKLGQGGKLHTLYAVVPHEKGAAAEAMVKKIQGVVAQAVSKDKGEILLLEIRSYDKGTLIKLARAFDQLGYETLVD